MDPYITQLPKAFQQHLQQLMEEYYSKLIDEITNITNEQYKIFL